MLRRMNAEDVPTVAAIHFSSWSPSEISVKLGPKFLELFYASIAGAPDAFTYLFEQDGKIIAYSSGFLRYQDFNRRLVRTRWMKFSRILLSRVIARAVTVTDICNLACDSRKLRKLRYPHVHWGAAALPNEYKGTSLGREAFNRTVHAVFRDLQQAGCPGCWGSCDSNNHAMEKWLKNLGFEKVDQVDFRGRSIMIYELTFTR